MRKRKKNVQVTIHLKPAVIESDLGPAPRMSSVDGSRVARGKWDVLALVGCSLLSGLLTQSVGTAGPDGVREQGPVLLCRL